MLKLQPLQNPKTLLPLLDLERPLTEDIRYSLFHRGETPWDDEEEFGESYLVDDPVTPSLVLRRDWNGSFYARNPEDFLPVLDYLETTVEPVDGVREVRFGGLAERWCRMLRERYTIPRENPCYVYYWNAPPPRKPQVEITEIGPEYAELVEKYWEFGGHDEDSITYIRWRLETGPSPAVFENGEPVAWCMTHGGGSMGNIFVLPEHRRRGLGLELSCAMIRRVIEGGWLPHCHIKQVNEASISMSEKAGLVCGGAVSWITAGLD